MSHDKDRELVDSILHPNGRCECHGEGTCPWCRRTLKAEAQEELEEAQAVRPEPTIPQAVLDKLRERLGGQGRVAVMVGPFHEGDFRLTGLDGEDMGRLVPAESGPEVEPVEVRTSEEAEEVFGEPASSRLTTAERDAMFKDLVDYVEARIVEDVAPGHDLLVTDVDAMVESIRTHPVMEIPNPFMSKPLTGLTSIHTEAQVTIPLRTSQEEGEALREWMEAVAGPRVDRQDWTWPEGATGLRLELATDVEVRDGRLVTPDDGVKGRFIDPDGVPAGSMELVCPSRTWLLTGVYPKGRSLPEDLADAAVGLQPIRWEVHPTGEPRLATERMDLTADDLPYTEAVPEALAGWTCRDCGDPAEVAYYYLDEDGAGGVTVYCGSCATDLDGVDWPKEVDDGQG